VGGRRYIQSGSPFAHPCRGHAGRQGDTSANRGHGAKSRSSGEVCLRARAPRGLCGGRSSAFAGTEARLRHCVPGLWRLWTVNQPPVPMPVKCPASDHRQPPQGDMPAVWAVQVTVRPGTTRIILAQRRTSWLIKKASVSWVWGRMAVPNSPTAQPSGSAGGMTRKFGCAARKLATVPSFSVRASEQVA